MLLLALGGYSLVQIAILAVVLLAVVGIVYVAAGAMGVPIPQWLVKIVAGL